MAINLTMTIRSEADLPRSIVTWWREMPGLFALTPNRVSLEEIFIETVGKDSGL